MQYLLGLILVSQVLYSQDFYISEVNLPKKISETSGIIYYNSAVITHNDSGGKAELYVLNTSNGDITETIKIKDAKNKDWEDIAQDENFIYIADTGNNDGNRKDLVIYKVAKEDFLQKKEVKSQKIKFKYKDQEDFTKTKHTTNFDCEAITVYKDQILLFTKNWGDKKTNVYTLPTKKGDYEVEKITTLNIEALLTSISYNPIKDTFIGTAYNDKYESKIIKVTHFLSKEQKFDFIELTDYLGYANQIEAIDWKTNDKFFFTRERLSKKVKGIKFEQKEKLFLMELTK